ncbi:SDR family oxidoreductase [Bdellovibrionota bacterium FG-1]
MKPSGLKTAIVTGGAKGIGKAISEKLATEKWNLVLCGRDLAALNSLADKLRKTHGTQVEIIPADLSKPCGVAELFSRWKSSEDLPQALICNAGDYGTLGKLSEVDFTGWKKSFDLNFFAVAEMLQHYIQIAGKGEPSQFRRKILVMSGSGLGGSQVWPGISAYGCAKAALYRLVEIVHEEVYATGIDINCLAPGAVKTGITEQAAQAGEKALGALYAATVKVQQSGGDSPDFAAQMTAALLDPRLDGVSGRLISAKWDKKILENPKTITENADLLRLRRIDNDLFSRSSK